MNLFKKSPSKKWLFMLFLVLIVFLLGAFFILNQKKFGKHPKEEDFQHLPNYKNGEFQNTLLTPTLTEDTSASYLLIRNLFKSYPRQKPKGPLPSQKTDLKSLNPQKDVIISLGHSSFYIQVSGKRLLIDPQFCGYAAPFSFLYKAFKGTNPYSADDIPNLDGIFITHDHWDHLDYESILSLNAKTKRFIMPLGVGSHLRLWGIDPLKIHEGNWNEKIQLDDLTIHITESRHFSGRGIQRNKTLWAGFAIKSLNQNIYVSGDTGYGPHFKEIGQKLGPFDYAILENGQYNPSWAYIHMKPEETVQAAKDLKTKAVIPSHFGKFALSYHSWDDPLIRLKKASHKAPYRLLTPLIGEVVYLEDESQSFKSWWEDFKDL